MEEVGRTPSAAAHTASREWWIKRSWTRLWWVGLNPHETLCETDTSTYYRAWTRERLIAKLTALSKPKASPWEEIRV